MIIQVRGTSGSGKSWVVHELMRRIEFTPVRIRNWGGRNRKIPLFYTANNDNIIICGNYGTVCGGCDSIGSARYVFNLYTMLKAWYPEAVIISEGLLLSEDVKWTTEAHRRGWNPVVYYLNTKADECIERINERRKAAGRDPLENELNTRARIEVIDRSKVKLRKAGVELRTVSSRQAPNHIMKRIT